MNSIIGSLCRHMQSHALGLGVVMYEYKPPFGEKTHSTQTLKKAYKVHWLQHPRLDVPPILGEHLINMQGVALD